MEIYMLVGIIAVMVAVMVVTREVEGDSPFDNPARKKVISRLNSTSTRSGLVTNGQNRRRVSRRFAGLPPTVESS